MVPCASPRLHLFSSICVRFWGNIEHGCGLCWQGERKEIAHFASLFDVSAKVKPRVERQPVGGQKEVSLGIGRLELDRSGFNIGPDESAARPAHLSC